MKLIDINSDEYQQSLETILDQVTSNILENSDSFEELKFYLKAYYCSEKHIQQDLYPIDHIIDDFDPYNEWISTNKKEL